MSDRIPCFLLAEHFAIRPREARRALSPALSSTGLVDRITPPETVLSACNTSTGPKQLVSWPFNGHGTDGEPDEENRLAFTAERTTATRPTTPTPDRLEPRVRNP